MSESGMDTGGRFEVRRPVLDLFAAAMAVALLAVGTWAGYWADHRNDQYQLLQLGRCVYEGGRPYVDCWENKPPGIAWLNALGLVLTGGDQTGAWVLPGLMGLLGVGVTWLAGVRLFTPTTGRRTAVFAAILYSMRLFDGTSINPDYYSGTLALTGAAFFVVGWLGPTLARRVALAFAAGLFWAASTSVKQTGCVGVIAVTLLTLVMLLLRSAERGRWVAAACGAWAGLLAGAGVVLAVLSRQQVLVPAWDAMVSFNRTLLTWETFRSGLGAASRLQIDLAALQLPLWVGSFGLVVTLLVGRAGRTTRGFAAAMGLWWAAETVLAMMGPSRTMRYWQGTFAPLVLLAAAGLFHVEEVFRQLARGYRAAFVLIFATVVVHVGRPLFAAYKLGVAESVLAYGEEDRKNDRTRLEEIGRRVAEVAPAGERIYVLAYDPGVYVHAERMAASRFTYPRTAEQMKEIVAELTGGKACAVLVPLRPAPEFQAFCDDVCHHELERALAGYEPARTVDGYRALVRTDESSGGN